MEEFTSKVPLKTVETDFTFTKVNEESQNIKDNASTTVINNADFRLERKIHAFDEELLKMVVKE